MVGDVIAEASERRRGRPLLERFVEGGELVRHDALDELRARALRDLGELPAPLRGSGDGAAPYPVRLSARLERLGAAPA